jgi:hypothetical protein
LTSEVPENPDERSVRETSPIRRGAAPGRHEDAGRTGARPKLVDKPGLSDPGVSAQQYGHDLRVTLGDRTKRIFEHVQLLRTSNELGGRRSNSHCMMLP